MAPAIKIIEEKKLVGKRIITTLAANKTPLLWGNFMRSRHAIQNRTSADYISMEIYDPTLNFATFNENTLFEKWAAVEVANFSSVPAEMECYILAGGLYAVFLHKGTHSEGIKLFQYIFTQWLPASAYTADNSRPHFEVMGDRYQGNDPGSEEEYWVPVIEK